MKNFGSHGCIKTKSSPNPYSRIWRTHFLGLNRKGSEKVLIFQCPLEVRMIFLQPVQRTALRNRGKRWPLRVRNRNTTLVATDRIIYNQKPPSCFFPTARGCPFPCTIICLPLCNKAVYLLSCTQPVSSVSVSGARPARCRSYNVRRSGPAASFPPVCPVFRKKRMISGLSLVSMDWIISFDFEVSPDEFPPP